MYPRAVSVSPLQRFFRCAAVVLCAVFAQAATAENQPLIQWQQNAAQQPAPLKPAPLPTRTLTAEEAVRAFQPNQGASAPRAETQPPRAPLPQRLGAVQAAHEEQTPATPIRRPAAPAATAPSTPTPTADAPRRLPRPGSSTTPGTSTGDSRPALPFSAPAGESLTTAGAGLAVVIALFLACVLLLRKGKPSANSKLPAEIVSVLGKVTLTPKHTAQLIQVGNKLVLVAISDHGIDTITEITDPTEVGRLLGTCVTRQPGSTSAEFQEVLRQLSREPATGFLGTGKPATKRG